MKILAIETSCDDTGIAVLEIKGNKKTPAFTVLSNVVASQTKVHQKYGGVFPAMAKREHQRNLLPSLETALSESKLLKYKGENNPTSKQTIVHFDDINKILEREPDLAEKLISFFQKYKKPNVDLITVTNGPGLEPCLWVGVNFAKALSYFWDIPIVPVNHIESHILVNFLENKKIDFPAIALVVSGGHTQLILVKKIGNYKILGETRDDAAGECFDKCAKIIGLGYPGGPEIAKLAAENGSPSISEVGGEQISIKLPRPMMHTKDYDFSFSGLKTAVLYAWQKLQKENSPIFATRQKIAPLQTLFAKEIQQAIIDVLIKKTIKAAKDYKAKTIILGGGVSANQELRRQFQLATSQLNGSHGPSEPIRLLFPTAGLSTDNAVMTAITAFFHYTKKIGWKKLQADANLRIGA